MKQADNQEDLSQKKKWQVVFHAAQIRMTGAEVTTSSAAIAYYLLLSLFPLVIAVGNILPFLDIDPELVLPYIAAMVPRNVYELLESIIRSLLQNTSGSLLSISALATLWAASRSINALQNSLNKVFGVKKRRNMVITRLFSFVAVFFFLMAVVFVAMFFMIGQYLIEYLTPIFNIPESIQGMFGTLRWPVTTITLFVTLFIIYSALPNAKVRLCSILPGTIFATAGWMILTQLFGLYTRFFSKNITSYGLIGSFIVFMLWLNFAATVIILGGIINAVCEMTISGKIEPRHPSIESMTKRVFGKFRKKF